MVNKYYFLYWLPKQSKLFSDPFYFGTDSFEEFTEKLNIAKEHGYEIEYIKGCKQETN